MSEVMPVDTAIIGAGPCGLGAAWRIEEWNRRHQEIKCPYLIIDANEKAGGWASSVVTPEGFVFDYGGHVLFPHEHDRVDFVCLAKDAVTTWSRTVPMRGVILHKRFIPTPVQRNVHHLPAWVFGQIVWGLLWAKTQRTAGDGQGNGDLESYLTRTFGKGMTQHVLGPLNQKMWAYPPKDLDACWTSRRSGSRLPNVADVGVGRLLVNVVLGRDDPSWTSETHVSYPAEGGAAALWNGIAEQFARGRLLRQTRVVRVWAGTKRLELDDGRLVDYQNLITTAPLDRFLGMIADRPDLARHADELRHASCALVGFGLQGAPPPWLAGVHGVHVPQEDIPFWRVSFPGNVAPGNVPDRLHWSVLCETSLAPESGAPDLGALTEQTRSGLIATGILSARDAVVSTWNTWLEHGYPTPFLGRDSVLRIVLPALRSAGILSRGRFGAWIYEVSNQDHAFFQGVEAADYVLEGRPESLVPF